MKQHPARGGDEWGRPTITGPHSAWSCNDRACPIHPASLYGSPEGSAVERVSIDDIPSAQIFSTSLSGVKVS